MQLVHSAPVRQRVLIVDDERVISDTLALILQHAGFEPTAVYSGESAVEVARSCAPDIVVSDILMRGMNGIEAALLIRAICPTCKIILISGASAVGDLLQQARSRGEDFEVLAKPFHPSELIRRMKA